MPLRGVTVRHSYRGAEMGARGKGTLRGSLRDGAALYVQGGSTHNRVT